MACEKIQQQILLRESWELSAVDRSELDDHLARCPGCRSYEQESRELMRLADTALPRGEPNAWVMTRIRAAAEERCVAGRHLLYWPAARILAAAALLAILVGGGLWMIPGDNQKSRVMEMSALMAVVASEETLQVSPLDADETKALSTGGVEDGRRASLRALAQQLLIMEGMAVDRQEETWANSPEGPEPTALQLRSTDDARGQIYG